MKLRSSSQEYNTLHPETFNTVTYDTLNLWQTSWIRTEEPVQKLTELWPDICKARVPQAHIELVVSGEQDGLLNGGLGHRVLHLNGEEGATVIGIRQDHRLHAWEPLWRWEFSQCWVIKRLQV